MLDVYTSLSQVKMPDLNFPLSFLANVIRVQAPKIKRDILCRIGVWKSLVGSKITTDLKF